MIQPKNIHGFALTYEGVGIENEAPLYFVKTQTAHCLSGAKISAPYTSAKFWTEVELGIIVARDFHSITEEEVEDVIEGFVVAADMTVENVHGRDHHLGYSKSQRMFCPTTPNPVSIPLDEVPSLVMQTFINGKLTQEGTAREMKFTIRYLVSYLSKIANVKKGDLIITGTPKGHENNILKIADKIEQKIERIGTLKYEII